MAPDSRSHRTRCPTALQLRRGRLGVNPTDRTIAIVAHGEVAEVHRHEPGAKVAMATGATDNLHNTTVRPNDRTKIVETDELNKNETLVMMSSHHETDETQGHDREVVIAIAVAMDPMDVTRQTRYLSLTNTGTDRVAKAPTSDCGSTNCTPT